MGCEPHSGVSHGRAPKWLKLETRMADSREWGFGGGGSQQPPRTSYRRSVVSFPVGSEAEPQKILIFCISGTHKMYIFLYYAT